ncbi:ABC transporter permease subunit [Desulfobotulus mexicanus]|uniref:CPBP family intramembrane metalloprotease n=1 Tax=Desulfobotulus mexicanus TaxID=2586642 RepID=A0A5Q4VBL3_9BACT|nr:CPBP family glutamic-type intramembrane protease [Desulfobotulus mexicanus]TYT75114.1 CPBP family intramembrane metalloprotease [Desulfobotulus mexicanus]
MAGFDSGFRRLNMGIVLTLFLAELRMLLRDRRTLFFSIVLPVLVAPLVLLAANGMEKWRTSLGAAQEYVFAVEGPLAELALGEVDAVLKRLSGENSRRSDIFRLRFMETPDPAAALEEGIIHFYLDTFSETHEDGDVPVIRVVFRADRSVSFKGAMRLMDELKKQRRIRQHDLVRKAGLSLSPEQLFMVSEEDVARPSQAAGRSLGRILPCFFLLFVIMGGAVVATDIMAGEKERGSLETLLTTAAGRGEIVASKFLLILAVSLTVLLVQAGNFLIYIGFELIPLPAGFHLDVSPAMAGLLFLLFLPAAAISSAAMLLISGYARSYKEAQLYFFPLLPFLMLPTLAPFLSGLELRSVMVLLPVANIAIGVREVLIGRFDWPLLIIGWLVTCGAAVRLLLWTADLLKAERLMMVSSEASSGLRSNPLVFPRHVLPAFAIMWAMLLYFALNFSEELGLVMQIFINMGVIFMGGSVLLLWRYRLPPVATLSLRRVRPVVWPAVFLGVPAAMLAGHGLFWLTSLVLPMSPDALEAFNRAMLPDNLSLWALLLLIGLFPAVCEELAFRGLLLHGLRSRYRFWGVVFLNGLIFGLFHVDLFRIVPTAFLGMIFAMITLLTGSIFPAMLWHGLNNMLAVLLHHAGVDLTVFGPWHFMAGFLVLVGVLWFIFVYGGDGKEPKIF